MCQDAPYLQQRVDDGPVTTPGGGSTSLSLTSGNWYTAKIVVDDDPNNSTLQRLRMWVDADNDGDWADETTLLDTTVVDDEWSAGAIGFFKGGGYAAVTQFVDFQVGFDNNADGDIADAGDDLRVSDDFNSTTASLAYDDNGNLTSDGVYKFVYDAWNRLRKAVLKVDTDETTIGDYEYYGDNRRSQKVVSRRGPENTANDGGDTTVVFYYDHQWRIVETRDGSNHTTFQYGWGTRYTDELLWLEKNGDPTASNDTNPDNEATGEESEEYADARCFVYQDRNWNVVAITEYDPAGTNNGRIVEGYAYTPYGEFSVLKGDADGDGIHNNIRINSYIGNIFMHQGLQFDSEIFGYANRFREYTIGFQRFMQRDPFSQYYKK